jgi:hypothetical protein
MLPVTSVNLLDDDVIAASFDVGPYFHGVISFLAKQVLLLCACEVERPADYVTDLFDCQ